MTGRALLASALALALVAPTAAAAQEPAGEASGAILTEELPPPALGPGPSTDSEVAGEAEGGPAFRRAPFRTEAPPVYFERIELPPTEERPAARLRALDKMTGRVETFDLAAGGRTTAWRLEVTLDACRSPADNAEQGTIAFLRVRDPRSEDAEPAFSGWMFAESPALSAMDHPRYDLWVISCITDSGAAAASSR